MIRLLILSFIVLFFHVDAAYSQNGQKWAVGADLLGLTNINTMPKYSVYSRYQITQKDAIRIRPGYYNVKAQPSFFNLKEQKTYSLRIGLERTKELYRKQVYLLYGIEYIYYNDHNFYFDYSNPTNQQSFLVADHKENGAGVFIGCRYFFIPNLSISTESSIQLTKTNIIKSRLGIDEYTYNFNSISIIPFSAFNLCFHF